MCSFDDDFIRESHFRCDIRLHQPDMDTMVIATPWDKKGEDSITIQENQLYACGRICGINGKRYEFFPDRNFGTLDWGPWGMDL